MAEKLIEGAGVSDSLGLTDLLFDGLLLDVNDLLGSLVSDCVRVKLGD